MSRSLQSSMEYFGGSKRWSRNDSDMVALKSSIGEISSKISSRPEVSGMSVRPSARAASTRARHFSLPSSQSKLSVWRARRFGTSKGSRILPKETRRGELLCEAAVSRVGCRSMLRWTAWRCARRPTGVLPELRELARADALPDCPRRSERRTTDIRNNRGQRKRAAYPARTALSSTRGATRQIPVGSTTITYYSTSRMTPLGPVVKHSGVTRLPRIPLPPDHETAIAGLRKRTSRTLMDRT